MSAASAWLFDIVCARGCVCVCACLSVCCSLVFVGVCFESAVAVTIAFVSVIGVVVVVVLMSLLLLLRQLPAVVAAATV